MTIGAFAGSKTTFGASLLGSDVLTSTTVQRGSSPGCVFTGFTTELGNATRGEEGELGDARRGVEGKSDDATRGEGGGSGDAT